MNRTVTREDIVNDMVAAGGDRKHLESLTEGQFRCLLGIAMHRADQQRFPHPGYDTE